MVRYVVCNASFPIFWRVQTLRVGQRKYEVIWQRLIERGFTGPEA